MLTTLALLLTAAPAQQPEPLGALDYLPADSVVCFEASREPWQRLGASTRLHALLGLEGVQECLDPTQEMLAGLDDEEMGGMGAALWNALAYSRLYTAVSVEDLNRSPRLMAGLELGPGAVIDLAALLPEAQRVELLGGELFVPAEGGSAFWRHDKLVLAAFQLGFVEVDDSAAWLEAQIRRARSGDRGLAALPSVGRLRGELAGGDDLVGVWVPAEALDLERWRAQVPETEREEAEQIFGLLTEAGLHDLGGFGWTISIDGPDLLDRTVIYKAGFGGEVLRPEVLAAADLPARAAALPGDTAVVRLAAFDMGAAVVELIRMAGILASAEGQPWPPEGMGEHFETAQRVAAALGPVAGHCLRAEDMWTAADDDSLMIGDIWIDVREPMELDAAMQRVPAEVMRLLEQGFPVRGKTFAARNQGSRLVITETSADPTESRLGDTPGFQRGLAPFRGYLEQGGVMVLDYAGPEFLAFVVQRLRDMGTDLDWEDMAGVPRIDRLPGFDELVGLVGPVAGVTQVRPDGVYVEYRSALGYSGSSLIGSSIDLLVGLGSWFEAVGEEVNAAAAEEDGPVR